MEKFMDELQILDDARGRAPDFRGHLRAPAGVARDTFAVAREIQRRPALPIGAEARAKPAAAAAWPQFEGEDRTAPGVPGPRRWRCRRVTGQIEPQGVIAAVLSGEGDK